jgi:hypothetical protein
MVMLKRCEIVILLEGFVMGDGWFVFPPLVQVSMIM